jgi:hypothetical protein
VTPIPAPDRGESRATHIRKTFAAAFAALDDYAHKGNAGDAAAIYESIVAHVRSASPQSFLVDTARTQLAPVEPAPAGAIERPLSDGQRYRIEIVDDVWCLHAIEDEERVVLAFTEAQWRTFGEDQKAVRR